MQAPRGSNFALMSWQGPGFPWEFVPLPDSTRTPPLSQLESDAPGDPWENTSVPDPLRGPQRLERPDGRPRR
jgi:hypothetical protein